MNEWLPKFTGQKLLAEIEKSTDGLTYISETDAAVEPYFGGRVETVEIHNLTDKGTGAGKYEKVQPEQFFKRLTAEKNWFGASEKQRAARFASLQKLLEENLRDLTVFKIGHIQIDIYVVGFDVDGNLVGIKTKAVET